LAFEFRDRPDVSEYSVMAWIQAQPDTTPEKSHFILRLTTNDKEIQADESFPGDRTLLIA
jgi:hypothetical protein